LHEDLCGYRVGKRRGVETGEIGNVEQGREIGTAKGERMKAEAARCRRVPLTKGESSTKGGGKTRIKRRFFVKFRGGRNDGKK